MSKKLLAYLFFPLNIFGVTPQKNASFTQLNNHSTISKAAECQFFFWKKNYGFTCSLPITNTKSSTGIYTFDAPIWQCLRAFSNKSMIVAVAHCTYKVCKSVCIYTLYEHVPLHYTDCGRQTRCLLNFIVYYSIYSTNVLPYVAYATNGGAS